MNFQIPDTDQLGRFTVTALRELGLEASAEYDRLLTEFRTAPENASDEALDYMEDLLTFTMSIDEEIGSRANRANRLAGHITKADTEPEPTPEETPAPVTAGANVPEVTTAATQAQVEFTTSATPSVAQVAASTTQTVTETPSEPEDEMAGAKFTLIAAPDVGFAAGSELKTWKDVAQAFVNRSAGYRGSTSVQQHPVAQVRRDFPDEFSMLEHDSDEQLKIKFDGLRDEKRLEGGSLLAGVGWCAPSETIYTTCSQVTIDGILSVPEIGARRGGIRHNTGIEFDSIFGAGTGFNILTEAQVIADTVKTCVAIPCPSFVDDRLKVAVLCLTGDILQNRGYPEFVSEFVQGAIAVQAHNVNRQIIADIVAASTAVSLAGEPFLSDGSVVSNVMSGVELAVTDIKYRLRLQRSATIEIVLPFWLKAQMRADWIRRNGPMDPDLADSQIEAMFRTRGANVQWVYDWLDAFSGVVGGMGADTPVTALPTALQFLAYPAGTWVVARQDVIRLDSIYDSTNITTNKVTQLFMEDGFRAMQFCPLSRVYSMTICPSGATGAQREVDCVTP
jgi:hypothetical protein